MNISLKWLKEYAPVTLDAGEIARILTNTGIEVSDIREHESIKGGLRGLVVGEVLECVPHPDSDHLHVTRVDVGGDAPLQIVCGAPNVAAGQKVVVATIGTTLYRGDEAFTIKRARVRGVESHGMICSGEETGTSDERDGILVLPPDATPGAEFKNYHDMYEDTIIEVEITPNRADAASHVGVARDLVAFLRQEHEETSLALPVTDAFRVDRVGAPLPVLLERPAACRRYAGIRVEGVTVKPSPAWLQHRLRAIGQHPINNVVDVTNYILFGLGQPLHAFDMAKIKGGKVIVKSVARGTRFVTLDGVERELHEDDLLICNAEEPMCIAGIFGGLESGISPSTTTVFIESACFDPVFTRKTSRRLGLSTDASFRYERGTDPDMVIPALKLAALMIKEVAGGEITSPVIDVYPEPVARAEILVNLSRVDRLLGKSIDRGRIFRILLALDMSVDFVGEDEVIVRVPPYRVDVRREADVIEEIARVHGYNHIEIPGKLHAALNPSVKPNNFKVKNMIADALVANGFHEVINNSLTKAAYFEGMDAFRAGETVTLCNPLSSDLNAMRQSLLFGGLENIAYNANRKNANLKLFEFGKAYSFHRDEHAGNPLAQYREEERLALFITGNKHPVSWNAPGDRSDFFTLKGYCEMILARLGLDLDEMDVDDVAGDLFREGARYSLGGKPVVALGIVHKTPLKRADVQQEVFHAEFTWDNILEKIAARPVTYKPVPRYPSVKRDLALLLDERVTFKEVRDLAFVTARSLLKSVSLFDVYEGERLGAGKKSYAVSFTLLDEGQTLTDKQIDRVMNKLVNAYKQQLHATIR
ncbi:MAG: phenylalanine--tRNA ligase subunit beta [Odoribacteraceae bacterium]|jgi:phenylalanyl-tRNA synthetase beta chain|nr:phenylalanine--tRNA ligase subunit beta [Odoribacteraceae bacterium]